MSVKRLPKRLANRRFKKVAHSEGSNSPINSESTSESDVMAKVRGLKKRGRSKSRA